MNGHRWRRCSSSEEPAPRPRSIGYAKHGALISGLSGEPGEWSCLLVIDKTTWSSCNRFLERAHYGFQRLIGLQAAVHVGGRELRQRIGSVTALRHGGHAGGAQHRITRRRSRRDAPHSLLIVFPHLGEVGPGAHSIDLRHAREMRPRDFVGLQRERELAGQRSVRNRESERCVGRNETAPNAGTPRPPPTAGPQPTVVDN